ncbi:MAG: SpoIIE family protein phosphatase [Thermoleophilaceae bacterium]|nr:SpoIIE family protein phosphatase [Thermoleophilaceae bacterium]
MEERRSDDELQTRLRQQAAVAELGHRALAGGDIADLLHEAVRRVATELGAPFVSLVEYSEQTGCFVERASAGLPRSTDEPFVARGGEGQTGFTLAAGEPVIVAELEEEGRFRPSRRLFALGARSSVSVPIGSRARPFGVLGASSRRARAFSPDDANFLQGVGNTLAAAIERARSETHLLEEQQRLETALGHASESEARFRELADSAPVLIWTADARGMIDFINRGWLEFTGRTHEEETGDTRVLGVHPDDAEGVRGSWWRAFRRRVPWEREYRLRRSDGEYRWIVDRGVPRFAGEILVGWVGTATDIHERKEMEEKLARAAARDQEVAETLQRSLLPENLPRIDGVQLQARYLPAAQGTKIGGDWYDAMELDDGRVAVVVGDVVGHGLRAATVMGQLRNAFRAYALVETSPAGTLARLNRLLSKEDRDVMATALYLILDRDTGEVVFSSAGHPPALVVTREGSHFLEGGRSVPLGTADPATYRDETTVIEPGSTMLLYTDGLVERRDTPLDDRLAQLATVADLADGDLSDVCDQVLQGILGGLRPSDDVALLAVRPEPVAAGALMMRLPADPSALAPLRRRVGRFLQAAGASEQERFDIILTVSEAAMNAIEHAYGPGDAEFELEASAVGPMVTLTVRDRGSWRERRGTERGRGLSIIEGMMDDVEVTPGPRGTSVRMRRRLGPASKAAAGLARSGAGSLGGQRV